MSEKKYICSIKRLKRLFQISWNLRDWASFTFMQVCSWQEPREWFRLLFLHAFILSYFLEKGCRFICNICRFHRILNFMIHGWTLNRPNTVWRSNIFSYIFPSTKGLKWELLCAYWWGFCSLLQSMVRCRNHVSIAGFVMALPMVRFRSEKVFFKDNLVSQAFLYTWKKESPVKIC